MYVKGVKSEVEEDAWCERKEAKEEKEWSFAGHAPC